MPEESTLSRIGRRPVLVAVLFLTGLGGFAFGTWLGGLDVATASQPMASPSPSPSSVATASPLMEPTQTPEPQGPQQVVLSIKGSDHDVSDAFEVEPGWQIVWESQGTSLAIAVTGDQGLGIVVDEAGPTSGAIPIAEGGIFRLEIAASGPWSIRVIQGEG